MFLFKQQHKLILWESLIIEKTYALIIKLYTPKNNPSSPYKLVQEPKNVV